MRNRSTPAAKVRAVVEKLEKTIATARKKKKGFGPTFDWHPTVESPTEFRHALKKAEPYLQ